MKMKFKVYNVNGIDITNTNDWYIDKEGILYFLFSSNDTNKLIAATDCTYEVILE